MVAPATGAPVRFTSWPESRRGVPLARVVDVAICVRSLSALTSHAVSRRCVELKIY
jgi:hypothetical protein